MSKDVAFSNNFGAFKTLKKRSNLALAYSRTQNKACGKALLYYCAFHKHANSEVQKPTDDCVFRCSQSSLTGSKGQGL